MPLSSFKRGKLRIVAHVREELDLAGLTAHAIQCKSGGTQIKPDMARLTLVLGEDTQSLDLHAAEVEDCEDIVTGETWHKIAGLIQKFK